MGSYVPEATANRNLQAVPVPIIPGQETPSRFVGGKAEAFLVCNLGSYIMEVGTTKCHTLYSPGLVGMPSGYKHEVVG